MPDQQITTTGIDALVEYLKVHGETDENKLAAELRVSEKVIEDWASILEKASIVKISYKVGKMFVSPLVVAGAEAKELKTAVETRKETAEGQVESGINVLDNLNKRIVELSKTVAGADAQFRKSAGPLKKDLDELERIQKEAESRFNTIKSEKDRIDKISQTFTTEMRALEEIAAKVQGFSTGESQIKVVVDDVRAKMKKYEELVNSMQSKFEGMIKEQRAATVLLRDQIVSEMKSLQGALDKQLKQLSENERLEKYAKRENATLKTQAEKDRMSVLNNVEKVKQSLDSAFSLSDKKSKEITEKVASMKKDFGGLAALNEQIGTFKSNLESVKKESDALRKEFEIMRAEIKVLEASKSEAERSSGIEAVGKKAAKAMGRAKEIEDSVKKQSSEIGSFGNAPEEPKV
ncbi:MAG: hypothetical protein KGH49_02605 [Candidatus Micrarchaeota archaeon]|nr:hypothetical protein [Candidatus Micrarchaeota archaeon]